MLKFVVQSVTVQDGLKVIKVESQKQPLFLGNDIPPGCIQNIIAKFSTCIRASKEECDNLCCVLCSLDMDDNSSRIQQNNVFCLVHRCKKLITRICSEDMVG